MQQQLFQSLDPLSRGADMAALTAIVTTLARQAIVRGKQDDAGAEQVELFAIPENGPANRAVADIQCDFEGPRKPVGS